MHVPSRCFANLYYCCLLLLLSLLSLSSWNFVENVVLEREHGVPRTLSCVLYCIESEFEQIIPKIRFIDLYLVFPTNCRIVLLPHIQAL